MWHVVSLQITNIKIYPMKKSNNPVLFWTPRILVLVFAVFISLFAMDVFDREHSFWETVLALLMHLIPTAVILVSLIIAWRWELFGAVFYFGLGLFYIFWAWGKFPISAYVSISGPLFIVGVLFFLSWHYQRRDVKKTG